MRRWFFIIFLLVFSLSVFSVDISNCTELQDMTLTLAGDHYLINDIDCSDTVNWNGGSGFDPVGNFSNNFLGNLYGNNFTVSNLFINRSSEDYNGIIGLSSGSYIEDLNVVNATIVGNSYSGVVVGQINALGLTNVNASGSVDCSSSDCGGVAGRLFSSYCSNCNFDGNVSGLGTQIGGLVGYGSGCTIFNSSSRGNVTNAGTRAGGLVGAIIVGLINHSHSESVVTGTSEVGGLMGMTNGGDVYYSWANSTTLNGHRVGGLVGYFSGADMKYSWAYGTVTSPTTLLGGLVGYGLSGSTISESFAVVNVTSSDARVGGIIGRASGVIIDNVFSSLSVSALDRVGGIVGYTDGVSISNSYSSAVITASTCGGGIIGDMTSATLSNNYWNIDVATVDSGRGCLNSVSSPSNASMEAKTSAELSEVSTFTGWDFNDTWSIHPSYNGGLPFLANLPIFSDIPEFVEYRNGGNIARRTVCNPYPECLCYAFKDEFDHLDICKEEVALKEVVVSEDFSLDLDAVLKYTFFALVVVLSGVVGFVMSGKGAKGVIVKKR